MNSQDEKITLPVITPASGFTKMFAGIINEIQVKDANNRDVLERIVVKNVGSRVFSVHIKTVIQDTEAKAEYTCDLVLEPYTRTNDNDDDYGGNNDWDIVTKFTELNNTSWRITNASVSQGSGYERTDLNLVNNSYSATRLRLATQDDILFWVDNSGTYRYDPLTVQCVNAQGQTITAPLIQSATGFKESRSAYDY